MGLTAQALGDGIILRDAYQFPDELRDVTILTRGVADGLTDGSALAADGAGDRCHAFGGRRSRYRMWRR